MLMMLLPVRCTVVGSYLMEEWFLEKEGVFLLIDLVEVQFLHYIMFYMLYLPPAEVKYKVKQT